MKEDRVGCCSLFFFFSDRILHNLISVVHGRWRKSNEILFCEKWQNQHHFLICCLIGSDAFSSFWCKWVVCSNSNTALCIQGTGDLKVSRCILHAFADETETLCLMSPGYCAKLHHCQSKWCWKALQLNCAVLFSSPRLSAEYVQQFFLLLRDVEKWEKGLLLLFFYQRATTMIKGLEASPLRVKAE